MKANIFEIKCPITDPDQKHHQLIDLGANYEGLDYQIDTYFNVNTGRLKLREGNIENTLIRYHRAEVKSVKQSKVIFQPLPSETVAGIKAIMVNTNGIWKIVEKHRRIYFIENVKFHIDNVVDLGNFMEIEAIDTDGSRSSSNLNEQCARFVELLQLDADSFIDKSYSDLIDSNS